MTREKVILTLCTFTSKTSYFSVPAYDWAAVFFVFFRVSLIIFILDMQLAKPCGCGSLLQSQKCSGKMAVDGGFRTQTSCWEASTLLRAVQLIQLVLPTEGI